MRQEKKEKKKNAVHCEGPSSLYKYPVPPTSVFLFFSSRMVNHNQKTGNQHPLYFLSPSLIVIPNQEQRTIAIYTFLFPRLY